MLLSKAAKPVPKAISRADTGDFEYNDYSDVVIVGEEDYNEAVGALAGPPVEGLKVDDQPSPVSEALDAGSIMLPFPIKEGLGAIWVVSFLKIILYQGTIL